MADNLRFEYEERDDARSEYEESDDEEEMCYGKSKEVLEERLRCAMAERKPQLEIEQSNFTFTLERARMLKVSTPALHTLAIFLELKTDCTRIIQAIASQTQLQDLSLRVWDEASEGDLSALGKLGQLTRLELLHWPSWLTGADAVITHRRRTQLKYLSLGEASKAGHTPNLGRIAVRHCTELEELQLHNAAHVDHKFLKFIHSAHIKTFLLEQRTITTLSLDQVLSCTAKWPKLTNLTAHVCHNSFTEFKNINLQLEELSVNGLKLKQGALQSGQLLSLKSMKKMYLFGTPELLDTDVEDIVRAMPLLQTVYLDSDKLTARSIRTLAGAKNITTRWIQVDGKPQLWARVMSRSMRTFLKHE